MMLAVVTALVFACVALVAYAVLDLAFSDDTHVARRLKGLSDFEISQAREAQPLLAPFRERVIAPLAGALAHGARGLWPADYRARVERLLERGGNPHGIDATRFLTSKILGATGAVSLVLVGAIVGGWSVFGTVVGVLGAGALAFFGPDWWLASVIGSRQHQIVRELPDMLDMLTISVEAGLGFDAALAKLVKNSRGPLAMEFGRALQEIQVGASRKEALRSMAERVDVPELSAFTAAIIQADIFGISVAQVLRTQSAEMRLRRRQRAEEQAQKLPVKMVLPLVLCLLPSTMLVVAGPAVIRIFEVFLG